MRLITALSVVSATGVLATNHQAAPSVWAAAPDPVAAMAPDYAAGTGMAVHDTAAMIQTAAGMHMTGAMTGGAPMVTEAPAYAASMAPPVAGAAAVTHTVTVGGDAGLIYTPNQIMAAVGDTVNFVFMRQNHTVTQSSFEKPCNKLSADAPDSGFKANANNTVVPPPSWEYVVDTTSPTWWYCKQRTGTHCGKGMVFAINPTAEKSFDAFKAAAIMLNGTADATTAPPPPAVTDVGTVTLVAGGGTATDAAVTTDAAAPPPPPAQTAAAMPPAVTAPGWNAGGVNTCNCACFCGVGAFPQGDGVGAYGGYGGSLPVPW